MKSILLFISFFVVLYIIVFLILFLVLFTRAVIRRYKELEEKRKDDES